MSCNIDTTEGSLKSLNDVFLLMDQTRSVGKEFSDREKKELEEINDRIKFYHLCFQRICDEHPSRRKHQKFSFDNLVPRFSQIVRDFLLVHQWPQALKWVHAITKEVANTDNIIWKAGLACLIQNGSQHLIQRFVRHVHVLKSLTCVEVLLDYLLHLLTFGDLVAKDLFTDLKWSDKFSQNVLSNERRKEAHMLFHAYQGLVLYLEWKTILSAQDPDDCDTAGVSIESHVTPPKTIADKAIGYLMSIKDRPGVWDIFVLKVVEIHEHYQSVDEARTLLQSYREENPTNPNAHRMLFEFEKRNEGDKDLILQCLKDLVELDPCNPLAITLFENLERTDPESVRLLFNYLDFDHCQNDLLVWNLIAKLLNEINEENMTTMKEVVMICWDVRKDWWPNFILPCNDHSTDGNREKGSSSLIQYKRIAQEALYNIGKQGPSSTKQTHVSPPKRKKPTV